MCSLYTLRAASSVFLLQNLEQLLQLGILRPNAPIFGLEQAVRPLDVQEVVYAALFVLLLELELQMVADVDLGVIVAELVHEYNEQPIIVLSGQEERPLAFHPSPPSAYSVDLVKHAEVDSLLDAPDGLVLLLQHLQVEYFGRVFSLGLFLFDIASSHWAIIQMSRRGPPLNPLDHLRSKGDLLPEIHFIGQITGGVGFESEDALLCEMTIQTGSDWELIYPNKDKTYQTQTTYAQRGEMFVWAHPFDLHFKANELSGWPKMVIKVWRFNDSSSTNDLLAYGMAHLPKHPGYSKIECETWTPYGDWKYQTLSFYLGTQARLNNLNVISTDLEKRKRLFSQSSGKVLIEVECITKNFGIYNISGS